MQGAPHGDDLSTTVVEGRSSVVEEVDRSLLMPDGGGGGEGCTGWWTGCVGLVMEGAGCSIGGLSGNRTRGCIIVEPRLRPEDLTGFGHLSDFVQRYWN